MKRNPSDNPQGRPVGGLKNRTGCGAQGGKEVWLIRQHVIRQTDRQAGRQADRQADRQFCKNSQHSFANIPNTVWQTFPTQFGKHSQHSLAKNSTTITVFLYMP